ncbi:hypothetical protein VOLCADRAFT_108551 [Volvox carteri f. nagariensis]|uniref:Uncharacterized protein n=1 Tax=Volvox carteri f. nagariensis TaxID=3068 RepID=D8UKW4_VOLCA|nr:uncharacterized protein VOLCADRAFT_108551 [Volvox carteri f. nagariensis]EFJ39635.1 hypothetical protein VOLCADRAFT_108551 [Volvox carteri f. nagariensis]|eukprot:XP_002959294.1 hypothetical protein VOLCADRAFT_108551 [Volvox carteri f. nagariensis]
MGHAWDTYVALKSQMASVSAHIAQLEMTMEQPAMKVLVSDKSGRVMERPLKDLDYVNDGWVNKSGKEHKALKRENRELNQIYHALQKGGDVVQGAGLPAASGNINVNANWWLSVCSSSWTKQWVQQGFPLWWKQAGVTPPPRVMRNHQGALEQRAFVTESVSALLAAGAVRQVAGVGSAGFLPEPVEVARSAGNPSRVTGTDREPTPLPRPFGSERGGWSHQAISGYWRRVKRLPRHRGRPPRRRCTRIRGKVLSRGAVPKLYSRL